MAQLAHGNSWWLQVANRLRIRLREIVDASAQNLTTFVRKSVMPSDTTHPDGWLGYPRPKQDARAKLFRWAPSGFHIVVFVFFFFLDRLQLLEYLRNH